MTKLREKDTGMRKPKWLYPETTKYDYFYILTGNKRDIWNMISIMLINPLLIFLVLSYVTNRKWRLFYIYLVADLAVMLYWYFAAKRRKRNMEWKKLQKEQHSLQKKLGELEERNWKE